MCLQFGNINAHCSPLFPPAFKNFPFFPRVRATVRRNLQYFLNIYRHNFTLMSTVCCERTRPHDLVGSSPHFIVGMMMG